MIWLISLVVISVIVSIVLLNLWIDWYQRQRQVMRGETLRMFALNLGIEPLANESDKNLRKRLVKYLEIGNNQ